MPLFRVFAALGHAPLRSTLFPYTTLFRSGKSTLLTPHQGEQLDSANDISADGKSVLVTSNAGNGYDNVGMLDIATKKIDRKSTRLNSSHANISYAVFCLKKKTYSVASLGA